jgi:hypothetical protein
MNTNQVVAQLVVLALLGSVHAFATPFDFGTLNLVGNGSTGWSFTSGGPNSYDNGSPELPAFYLSGNVGTGTGTGNGDKLAKGDYTLTYWQSQYTSTEGSLYVEVYAWDGSAETFITSQNPTDSGSQVWNSFDINFTIGPALAGQDLRLKFIADGTGGYVAFDTISCDFIPGTPYISLSSTNVVTNASPGTLVGNLAMANTNGTFSYAMETTSGDNGHFDIPASTTNLRTAAWLDSNSYNISIVGTETGGGGLIVTNDFTINVTTADDIPDFVVSAEVQSGSTDGTVVGTAQTIQSGATFSISGGREDLFYFDGNELKVTNSASWGSIGTTNYVTLQAVVGSGTNELIVAASVVSGTPSATIFRFR